MRSTSPAAAPDYGRDEKFQRHYAEAAATEEGWQTFVQTYLSGGEAEYQAAVRKFREEVVTDTDRAKRGESPTCFAMRGQSWSAP